MILPDWLPKEAWTEFLAMRKRKKKPMTDYAIKLAINKLDRLRADGEDPEAVLNESIFHEWDGLFPVRKSVQQRSSANAYPGESQQQYEDRRRQEERRKEPRTQMPAEVRQQLQSFIKKSVH
jgi:hypothetical protein